MRKMIAVLALVVLAACGSSPVGPSAVPTPAPTPTPPPDHSGIYTGTNMTFLTNDLAPLNENRGTITVVHSRESLVFSNLRVTHAGGVDFTVGLGSATLDATDHFTGIGSYSTAGCGAVSVRMTGWFAGDAMNFTGRFTPADTSCGWMEISGEMRR